MPGSKLKPAAELVKDNSFRFPNESADYRRARNALLVEEIELRRQIERVAELRRALPDGGAVTTSYEFVGENGRVTLEGLFGDKQSLVVYSYMFGPQRDKPCPMCTSLLSAWDGEVPDITQRVALAVVARSPIERLMAFKRQAAGITCRCIRIPPAPSAGTTTALPKTAATMRPSTSSPAATGPSGISGPAR